MVAKGVREEVLETFRANLNKIPGVNITTEAVKAGKYPSITAQSLIKEDSLKNFQDVVLALCQQLET